MDPFQKPAKPAPKPLENGKKHSLGQRAFFIFLFARIKYVAFMFALTLGVWYAQQWVPPDYAIWGTYATQLLFMVSVAFFLMVFMRTYFEYRYYTYLFTEEAFIMTFGYIVRNEIATLYHHIQNVNIERSILDRAIGVSKVIIMMTGSDRDTRRNQIVLPAVGRAKARLVQNELLHRARRQAVVNRVDEA